MGAGLLWPDICPPAPGSPAPVRALEMEATAAPPVSLATRASTVSSKFSDGSGKRRDK